MINVRHRHGRVEIAQRAQEEEGREASLTASARFSEVTG